MLSFKLNKCPLFKGIAIEELEGLLSAVSFKIKKFDAENLIASRDEECNNLIIVISGSVRGEMLDYSGKVLKVEDIKAPKPIASAFIFGQQNRFPVDVIANSEVSLLYISRKQVLEMFTESPVFLNNYLNAIANRAQFLTERIWFLSFKTIRGKLAQYLLHLAKGGRRTVELPLTQRQLADFFGVARPSLARSLSEMQKENLISINKKEITLLDLEVLKNIIE